MGRFVCISALLLVGMLLCVEARPEELYSSQYDDIDPETILRDDTIRNQYYNCFMDTGPCVTPDAQYFKEHLPEAMATECRKCTEKQKQNFEKVALWYTDNKPDEWTALVVKLLEEAKKMNAQN